MFIILSNENRKNLINKRLYIFRRLNVEFIRTKNVTKYYINLISKDLIRYAEEYFFFFRTFTSNLLFQKLIDIEGVFEKISRSSLTTIRNLG